MQAQLVGLDVRRMSDIRPSIQNEFPATESLYDWMLTDQGVLDESYALATLVTVALNTDARARADDVLPDPDSDDLAGWWGDLDAEEIWNGWPIGSRLWLMRRDKITTAHGGQEATLYRAEKYIREALRPLQDRQICTRFDTRVERRGLHTIYALIVVYRGPHNSINLRYQILWDD